MTTTIRPDHADDTQHRGYYDAARQNRNLGHQYNYLQLIWDENDVTLEYTLRYNQTRRGFWISSSPQKSKQRSLKPSPYVLIRFGLCLYQKAP